MKYRPTYFLPLFLSVLLGMSSCAYQHYKGFEPVTNVSAIIPAVYKTTFNKAIYTTTFNVFGRELSGITIVKKLPSDKSIHIVFMSQIGLKFFDMEIRQNEQADWFHVNYMMESLNREFIIDMLKKDLMLLFSKYPENYTTTLYQKPGSGSSETTIRFGPYTSSVLTDGHGHVTGIEFRKGRSVKTLIEIIPGTDYPKKVHVRNKKYGLLWSWEEINM